LTEISKKTRRNRLGTAKDLPLQEKQMVRAKTGGLLMGNTRGGKGERTWEGEPFPPLPSRDL